MTTEERQIARINELSGLARSSWIGLLAYLAFIFVTLLGVEDADFFVPSRQTQLPLVNVSIPTASFFYFAPILAAALYVYLHLFLFKLWDAIAAMPSHVRVHEERPEWVPLADAIHPWLANDLACLIKGGGALPWRPLRLLAGFVTLLLVWLAGPLVIFAFWRVSMAAHDEWLTLLIAACLWFAVLAMVASAAWAILRLRGRRLRLWHWTAFVPGAALLFAALAWDSWLRTEGGFDRYAPFVLRHVYGAEVYETRFRTCDPDKEEHCLDAFGEPWPPDILEERSIAAFLKDWTPADEVAAAELTDQQLVPLPAEWRNRETARREFREVWCRREGLPMNVCGHLPDADRPLPDHVTAHRMDWCGGHGTPDDDCAAEFTEKDRQFRDDWVEERGSGIASLPALDLRRRDLRRADAGGVLLVGADLSGVRLEGANLRDARLEGGTSATHGWRGRTSQGAGWRRRTSSGRDCRVPTVVRRGSTGRIFAGRGWRGQILAKRGLRGRTSTERG